MSKIITKQQFLALNQKAAIMMNKNSRLGYKAKSVFVEADKYRWIHQNSWMGEPLLNLPQDMFAVQEIIYKTKPDYIIETGVAWGGSLLFSASMLELMGGKKVIGIDIYIPKNLRSRLAKNARLFSRIKLVSGSSTDCGTIEQVKKIIGKCKKVMVILDSFHTHDHVLKELRSYAPFVGKGFYLICGDTIVESIPAQGHRPRPWGPGNNPATALKEFLKTNKRFSVDRDIEAKLLFTCHPGGYLNAKS
jgi:cephalosporin hydroxylase